MKKCKTGGMVNTNKKATTQKSATKQVGGGNKKAQVSPTKMKKGGSTKK